LPTFGVFHSFSCMHALASAQHGVVTRAQLRAAGIGDAAVRRRLSRGELVAVSLSVLRFTAAPVTDEQRAVAAVLDVGHGAVVARESAAALWGLSGFRVAPVQLVRPRAGARRTSALAEVRTTTVLGPGHVGERHGIPLTTPARTLCDLAPGLHPTRLEWLFHKMWSLRLLDRDRLAETAEELASRGRAGTTAIRELLDRTRGIERPSESNLESRLDQLVARDGQPPLDRQVDVGGSTWIGRVDRLDRRARLVVEVQSERFHGSVLDQRRDARRRQELEDAGWRVFEVSEHDLWHDPAPMLARLRAARAQAPAGSWRDPRTDLAADRAENGGTRAGGAREGPLPHVAVRRPAAHQRFR
jgi:very-short-patch-repair endonuclease